MKCLKHASQTKKEHVEVVRFGKLFRFSALKSFPFWENFCPLPFTTYESGNDGFKRENPTGLGLVFYNGSLIYLYSYFPAYQSTRRRKHEDEKLLSEKETNISAYKCSNVFSESSGKDKAIIWITPLIRNDYFRDFFGQLFVLREHKKSNTLRDGELGHLG